MEGDGVNKKLQRAMVLFFALLILFIIVVYFAEINNMNDLRLEYPELQDEAFSFRKDTLKVWGVRLLLTLQGFIRLMLELLFQLHIFHWIM